MATLFALGVMSVAWMVLVSAVIAAEKLLPRNEVVGRGIVVLLALLAVGVAFAPEDVPALTIPGSPAAMDASDHRGQSRWSRRDRCEWKMGPGQCPSSHHTPKHLTVSARQPNRAEPKF